MYGDAIEAYKEALRNNPRDNETRYNLELCKRQQKQQKQQQQHFHHLLMRVLLPLQYWKQHVFVLKEDFLQATTFLVEVPVHENILRLYLIAWFPFSQEVLGLLQAQFHK